MSASKAAQTPAGRTGAPMKPSKGLAGIDELLAAGKRHEVNVKRKEQSDEIRRILDAMHRIEATSGGESVADVLDRMVATTPISSMDPRTSLTQAQVQVLERVGSFVDKMPPDSERASTRTRTRGAQLLADSLAGAEVAALLGVSPSRVRQRVSDRTLYTIKTKSGSRFPRFQFTDNGELPGWDVVASTIPAEVHPLTVQNVMLAACDELELDGAQVCPRDWLAAAGAPDRVVEVLNGAFDLDT